MTEILNKEFSRTSFVKGGGALVVGFSVVGAGVGGKATKAAGIDPYASMGPYDAQAIDSWIAIHADNTATIKFGKVELGQGTGTGLSMIAAEELDMKLSQMRYTTHDTNVTANQGGTSGSNGISGGGVQVRAAAAAARNALLDLAAVNLGVAKASLTVADGVVSGGGRSVKYGDLLGDKLFNVRMPAAPSLGAGAPGTKAIKDYKIVGHHGIARYDIPAKVNGKFVYVHNIKVPGMLHGRVVRTRGQGAYGRGTAPEVLSVDARSIKHIQGAQVVRHRNFIGVVAPTEYAAIQASAQLKVKFAELPTVSGVGNLWKQMREHDSAGKAPARISANTGNFESAFASAPIKLSNSYAFHYNASNPIGPLCAVADVTPNGARIFSNTQDAYGTRGQVQIVLNEVMGAKAPPLNRIRVTYYEGSSSYGSSSPMHDAAEAAAIMSALTGKPVRMQFMRWDEHGWGNYGPAQLDDVRGAVDANGNLVAFEFTGFGIGNITTYASEQQVTGLFAPAGEGPLDTTISGTQYNIANRKVIGKSVPVIDNYFKTRPLRAPNAPQAAFAAEQMVDELAYAAKMDPVAFRLKNIATVTTDPSQRWKNALETAVKAAGWQPRVAASNLSNANVVTGRGVAFGHYSSSRVAGIVDIELNKKTGKITVKNVTVGSDTGFIVFPDGMHSNEEGAIMQGVSRGLLEQVSFDRKAVTSLDWVTYPMIRFKDAPKVTLVANSRTDVPMTDTQTVAAAGSRSTGSGEPGLVPIPAAIANAFFDATGVRIREAPMTPGRVRAVLRAAGK
jgi:CO/xanthine dehydrogenase Mo-binding subunit